MKTYSSRLLFASLTLASMATLNANPYEATPVSVASEAAIVNFEEGAFLSDTEVGNFNAEPAASTAGGGGAAAGEPASNAAARNVGIEVGGGAFEIGGLTGELYTIRIPYSKRINERSTLHLTVPLSLTNFNNNKLVGLKFEDTQAYGFGLNAGWAWQAFLKKDNVPYRWKITPAAGVYYRDSKDLNNGSLVFNVGLSSSFAWQFKPGWVINMGNSISNAWNNGIRDYPDPIRDNQQTFSNGLQLIHMTGRWTYHAYFIHAQALNDVVVDSNRTVGVGAGYKLTRTRSLKATFLHESGNGDYSATRGTIGTTWEF